VQPVNPPANPAANAAVNPPANVTANAAGNVANKQLMLPVPNQTPLPTQDKTQELNLHQYKLTMLKVSTLMYKRRSGDSMTYNYDRDHGVPDALDANNPV
jgi:hypothetical protein